MVCKHDVLSSLQVFVRYVVIPSGVRGERLRVDNRSEFVGKEFRSYCLQTGVSLEYASTNTPQLIGISDRVGRTVAAMVRCMLTGNGLPKFIWGELMFAAAFLGNGATHDRHAVPVQNAAWYGAGSATSSIHRCPGLRANRDVLQNYGTQGVGRRLVGNSNNSKSYRVYNQATRLIMKSKNGMSIETQLGLLPPPSEETSPHSILSSKGVDYSRQRQRKLRHTVFCRAKAWTPQLH